MIGCPKKKVIPYCKELVNNVHSSKKSIEDHTSKQNELLTGQGHHKLM